MVAGESAAVRPDADYTVAEHVETQYPSVLQEPSAAIAQCPRVGLKRAMRVRVAAEMVIVAAEDIVSGERHELPNLLGIQHIGVEALMGAVVERAPVKLELPLIERDANPIRLELGRITEQLVHQGPQALLFAKERTVMM